MSLAQRFERRLEGMVGSAFARVFKGQVEPVEIGNALQREAMDKKAVMGNGQVLAPNRYRVTLGSSDYERLAPVGGPAHRARWPSWCRSTSTTTGWPPSATSRSTWPTTRRCTPASSGSRPGWSRRPRRAAGRWTRCRCRWSPASRSEYVQPLRRAPMPRPPPAPPSASLPPPAAPQPPAYPAAAGQYQPPHQQPASAAAAALRRAAAPAGLPGPADRGRHPARDRPEATAATSSAAAPTPTCS